MNEPCGKRRWRSPGWWIALAGALTLLSAPGARAETEAAFTAHYEHQAQVVTELLTEARALPAAQQTHAAAVARSVTALDSRTAALYTQYQALSAAGAQPLPPARLSQDILSALRAATSGLATEIQAGKQAPGGNAAWRTRMAGLIDSAGQSEQQIDQETGSVKASSQLPAFRTSAAAQSSVLQTAIAQLQATAISLLNAWLLLSDTSRAASQPVTIQDLAYTTNAITIPARRKGATTDTVGVQPQVTDANGRVLPDTGNYRIGGPAKFHGVTVDHLIGTVTVRPGATPGQYTVTYTQGRARQQVTLQVTP